ncbi:hypothetical protein GCM10023067_60200 [Aminobacter aganoensis]
MLAVMGVRARHGLFQKQASAVGSHREFRMPGTRTTPFTGLTSDMSDTISLLTIEILANESLRMASKLPAGPYRSRS